MISSAKKFFGLPKTRIHPRGRRNRTMFSESGIVKPGPNFRRHLIRATRQPVYWILFLWLLPGRSYTGCSVNEGCYRPFDRFIDSFFLRVRVQPSPHGDIFHYGKKFTERRDGEFLGCRIRKEARGDRRDRAICECPSDASEKRRGFIEYSALLLLLLLLYVHARGRPSTPRNFCEKIFFF